MQSYTSDHVTNVTKDTVDWSQIPDVHTAQNLIKGYFPERLFPRLHDNIKNRISHQFYNWNQCLPDIRVARLDWRSLRESLYYAGRDLPLLAITQISYGCGMGHSKIGLHRGPKFDGEETNTYIYHAAPGLSLRGDQAADYCRLDHVSRKPTMYVFWVLNYEFCHQGSEELHKRWMHHRFTCCNSYYCDCATFINDFTRYMASVGNDYNNPFNYSIPSHTIKEPVRSEDRGLYAILQNTHRPPAMIIFAQDGFTYDRICSHGYSDAHGWIVDYDTLEFNVTKQ